MPQRSLRLLLIDDEASLRKPLARYLHEQQGYVVEEAASFQQALEKVETDSESYDVALIDDMLVRTEKGEPEPLGIELMKSIRDRSSSTEFILFTGWGMDSGLEAMRQGAYRYIRKPFDLDELAFMIEHAAEYRALKEEAKEKRILRQLMESSAVLHGSLDLKDILHSICQSVHASGFDRVRLYLLSEDQQILEGHAQVNSPPGVVGLTKQVSEDRYMQQLLIDPRPMVFERDNMEPVPFEQELDKEGVQQWACVPLIVWGKMIGKLSVDNKLTRRPINLAELEPITVFAAQAAAAIENAQLRQEERSAANKADFRARKLEAIQTVSEALNKNLVLIDTLEVACRAAVELFDVDHSGLALFDPDLTRGVVKAEFPTDVGAVGTVIPIEGVSDEEKLVHLRQPLMVKGVADQKSLGPVRAILQGFGIESILVVPMVFNNRVIGSFSLDAIGRKRSFSQDEIDLCMILAGQVASAVDNAQLFEETKRLAAQQKQFVSDSPVAVIANDSDGKIIDVNRRAEILLGYSEAELLNQPVENVYFNPNEAHTVGSRLQATKDGTIANYETLARKKSGEPISVRLAVTSLHNALGQAIGALGHFEDMRYLETQRQLFAQSLIYQRISDSIQSAKDLNEVFYLALTGITAGFGLGLNCAALFLRSQDGADLVGRAGIGHPDHTETYAIWENIQRQGLTEIERFREQLKNQTIPDSPLGERIQGMILPIDPAGNDILSDVTQIGDWRCVDTEDELDRLPEEFRERFQPQAPLVVVALRSRGEVIGLIVADNRFTKAPISNEAIQSLISFANTVAVAIDNTQLLEATKRQAVQLERVRLDALRMADQVEQAPLLEEIITRAVNLLDARSGGVYEYDRERGELSIIADYPEDRGVVGQVLKVGEGMAGRLVQSERPYISTSDYATSIFRANNFQEEQTFGSVIEVPLRWRDEIVGVLYVDDQVGRQFRADDANLLQMFADHAAAALVNARTLDESEKARQELRSAFEAGVALSGIGNPEQVLSHAVERVRKMAHAEWVSVVLIDKKGHARNLIVKGEGGESNVDRIVRKGSEESISKRVIATGIPEIIENAQTHPRAVNRYMIDQGVHAALCLPFSVHGERIGVAWIHYNQPRRFQRFEVDALQLFANQAAVAYDSSRKIETLENLHKAAGTLATAENPKAMLKRIADSAVEVLQAKSAAIWSYDGAKGTFLIEESTATGIGDEDWDAFRKAAPRDGGTATKVMAEGWIGVEDISDEQNYPYLGEKTTSRLRQSGIRSFQGICLQIGDERLGVLYVNYERPQGFTVEERRITQTFADYAVLALKKARLHRRIQQTHETSRVVAEMTVLQDLPNTLESVVIGTKNALNCDAVVLYAYNREEELLEHPPTMIGVENTGAKHKGSIVLEMLELDDPYIVRDTSQNSRFRDRRFTSEEGIASVIVIPLSVYGDRVGVMFVNYRNPHRFSEEEIADIQLFANQAAVAIHDAQLFDKTNKRAGVLEALNEAGRIVTGSLDPDETLKRLVEQAWHLVGDVKRPVNFACIRLVGNNTARLVAAYPPDKYEQLCGHINKEVDLEKGVNGRIGIMGRAANTGESQLVHDVQLDPDYLECDKETSSDLAVPIKIGEQVIGVMNVEHSEQNAFDKQDQQALEALAAQAAIAINNAQLYEELKEIKGLVGARTALAWMGMANNAWRHSIEGSAINIRNAATLLKLQMPQTEQIAKKLGLIERLANEILEKPITPPLSSEEGVQIVMVNDLISERTKQLWTNDEYKRVSLTLKLDPDEKTRVLISSEWLRRAFDILVDNAIDAMRELPDPHIDITTRRSSRSIEIVISDTGNGIPGELVPKLFREQIEHTEGEEGMGMGLLMVQAIIQTYGGEVRLESTGNQGTTMVVSLPLAVHR